MCGKGCAERLLHAPGRVIPGWGLVSYQRQNMSDAIFSLSQTSMPWAFKTAQLHKQEALGLDSTTNTVQLYTTRA